MKWQLFNVRRYVPTKLLLLNKFSILLITCILLYCLFSSQHTRRKNKDEDRPLNLHIPDKAPKCLPDFKLLDSKAVQNAPFDMFHEHPYDRTPIVLLSAYEFDNNILVTLQNDGFMGKQVYCHYRTEEYEKLGKPTAGFVYPQHVVNCCKRKGAKYVSVTEHLNGTATNFVLNQNRTATKPKYTLSMCLSPMYGTSPKWLLLAELIEHSKLHGVEHFYLYVKDMDEYSRELLNSYVSTGEAELIHFSDDIVRIGDLWQQVSIADCVVRSRHESKYIISQDIDERITATSGTTNLREYVHRFFLRHEDVAEMVFRQLWIIRDELPPEKYEGEEMLRLHLPTLVFQNTSAMTAPGHFAKTIIDPLKILSMGVHRAYDMYPGYNRYFVPPELFTIRHYREVVHNDWMDRVLPETAAFGSYRMTRYPPRLQARLFANTPSISHVVLDTEAAISSYGRIPVEVPKEGEILIDTALGPKSYEQLEKELFQPMGYTIREKTIIPALDYITAPNCPEIFIEWLRRSEVQNESGEPPKEIPPELLNKYTLNDHIHLIMSYNDARSGVNLATWTREEIDGLVAGEVSTKNYDGEERGMFEAMKAYSRGVTEREGIVIGSMTPWLESFPLKLNASHVRTIEYMKINVDHPKVDYRHPVQLAKEYDQHIGAYDWAASFSSIEHSGLGRYGDALDPEGDLKEAKKTYCMLKKGGYFFLGFPMGYDTVHWNLHRIYGRIRLALIFTGFDLIDIFYNDKRIPLQASDFAKAKEGQYKQFVVVLKKR